MNRPAEFDSMETELLDLTDACLSDSISDEQLARLDDLVSRNPTARQIYVRCIQDGLLLKSCAVSAQDIHVLVGSTQPEDAARSETTPSEAGSAPVASPGLPILGFLHSSLRHLPGGEFTVGSLVIAGVVAAVIGVAAYRLQLPREEEQRGPRAANAMLPNRGPIAPRVAASAPAFARLTADANCIWDEEQKLASAGAARDVELEPGQRLALQTGVAQIWLASGVHLVIEGPVQLEVQSVGLCDLASGRLFARVPHTATGFTVATPTAQVVDLGTEFGVEVDSEGATDVHVTQGVVEVKRDVPAIAGETGTHLLKAGQAARISIDGQIKSIPANATRFVKPVPPSVASQPTAHPDGRPIIWLGNLFDDSRGTPLADALESDTFGAVAEIEDLGIESVFMGGDATKTLGGSVRFDFTNLGWNGQGFNRVLNDCWVGDGLRGIRTQGKPDDADRDARVEEGIGMHSNAVVTFNLDELRAAGDLNRRRMLFIADRAGFNRDGLNGAPDPRLHLLVLVSDGRRVLSATLNGHDAKATETDGTWSVSQVGEPLKLREPCVEFRVPVPPGASFLTLAVCGAGVNWDDRAAWSGARLEVVK